MKKIIVVDRNPNIRRLIQNELIVEGYTVFAPANEMEFIELFNGKRKMDLLIIDPDIFDMNFSRVRSQINDFSPVIVNSLAIDGDKDLFFAFIHGCLHDEDNPKIQPKVYHSSHFQEDVWFHQH
ncbi:MAG: hypothetical protein M0Z56_02075 [Desulfobacteraceae bacterium]|nr:hypothetical protein [Desulfobacteraceae bacterium]